MNCQFPEHRFLPTGECVGCGAKVPDNYFASEPDERAAIMSVEREQEENDKVRTNEQH